MPRALRRKTRTRAVLRDALAEVCRQELHILLADDDLPRIIDFVSRAEPSLVRRALIDMLLAGEIGRLTSSAFVGACLALDSADLLPKLRGVARSGRRPLDVRAVAAAVLAALDSPGFDGFRQAHPHVIEHLTRRNVQADLLRVERRPQSSASEVLDRLYAADDVHFQRFVDRIEAERAALGTPAGLVYCMLLQIPHLAPRWPRILERLVEEADFEALAALDEALETVDGAASMPLVAARQQIREALDAGRARPRPSARAWMWPADATGRHVLAIAVDRPGGGALFASVEVDRTGLLLGSGQVEPEAGRDSVDGFVERLGGHLGRAAKIPAIDAADRVHRAGCRAEDADIRLLDHDWGAYFAFRRVQRPGDSDADAVPPGEAPDEGWLAEHFDAIGDRQWFWDDETRGPWSLGLPTAIDDADWTDACIAASVERAADLACAARQRARWHALLGEAEAAAAMAAAAAAVERDPADAPLTRITAERTCQRLFLGER